MEEEKIKLKAMCVFYKDGRALLSKGFDRVKNEHFYRVLGGGIDFFESGEEGVRREIREELESEIENLKLLDVKENLFTYQGKRGHEIDFLYNGDLVRKELYEMNSIRIVEPDMEFEAFWIPVKEIFEQGLQIYPIYNYQELFKP